MLNKELCIKCWEEYGGGWIGIDERRWKQECVVCPSIYLEKAKIIYRKITNKPPTKCPYYLENII